MITSMKSTQESVTFRHSGVGLSGVDLEPGFLGVSRTPKLENLGVRQQIWESAIFLKYNIQFISLVNFLFRV